MSTRCNIIIKDGRSRFYLYHNHDGYPEGVGTELREYIARNWMEPWRKYWVAKFIANELLHCKATYPMSDNTPDDEYEVTSGLHGDVEFVYVVNCQAMTLRCYAVTWDDDCHQNFQINWRRVFRRDHLVNIPTYEERAAWIERQNARIAAAAKRALV